MLALTEMLAKYNQHFEPKPALDKKGCEITEKFLTQLNKASETLHSQPLLNIAHLTKAELSDLLNMRHKMKLLIEIAEKKYYANKCK